MRREILIYNLNDLHGLNNLNDLNDLNDLIWNFCSRKKCMSGEREGMHYRSEHPEDGALIISLAHEFGSERANE